MSESSEIRGRNIMIAVTTAAVVIVVAVAVAVGWSNRSGDDGTVAVGPSDAQTDDDASSATPGDERMAAGEGTMLPEAMSGQEAVDALGDKLAVVAERNNMTAEKLRKLLLTDSTLHVTPSGSLLYVDTMTPPPSE